MGNLCSTRPKSEDKPKTTTTTTTTLNSILGSTTIQQLITEVTEENSATPAADIIFIAKIFLLDEDKINEIRNQLTTIVLSKKLKTKNEVKVELINIVKNLEVPGLTTEVAEYYVMLYLSLIVYITLVDPNSVNNSTLVLRIKASSRDYAFETPRKNISQATTEIKSVICTSGYGLTCPPPDPEEPVEPVEPVSEGFQNRRDIIKAELKRHLGLIFKQSTEPFKNNKIKRENNFSGYSLEYTSLLPKDYADF